MIATMCEERRQGLAYVLQELETKASNLRSKIRSHRLQPICDSLAARQGKPTQIQVEPDKEMHTGETDVGALTRNICQGTLTRDRGQLHTEHEQRCLGLAGQLQNLGKQLQCAQEQQRHKAEKEAGVTKF